MKKILNAKFPPVSDGRTVSIPLPDVDRAKTDFRNVLAVVIEVTDDFFKLCTPHGILRALYFRNQFTPCKEDLIPLSDVNPEEKSLRQIVSISSITDNIGQMRLANDHISKNGRPITTLAGWFDQSSH